MPRVKLNEPARDRVKELILGQKHRCAFDDERMAKLMGVSRATYSRRMNQQKTTEWPLREVLRTCKQLNVPIDELREAIRY